MPISWIAHILLVYGGNIKWYDHSEKQSVVSYKTRQATTVLFNNFILGHLSQINKCLAAL